MIATCGGRHRKPLNPNMTTAGIIPASPTSPGPILTNRPIPRRPVLVAVLGAVGSDRWIDKRDSEKKRN